MDAERSPNGCPTDTERIPNGPRTDPAWTPHGSRTDLARTLNETRTDPEWTPHGRSPRTDLSNVSFSRPERGEGSEKSIKMTITS